MILEYSDRYYFSENKLNKEAIMNVVFVSKIKKFAVIDNNGFVIGLFNTVSEAWKFIHRINSLWG